MVAGTLAAGQTLPLPERAANAPAGRDFAGRIESLALPEREQEILAQILAGNAPNFLRRLSAVTVTNGAGGTTNRATFFVTPDYLCVGADEDFFLAPMTPATAQRIADWLGCTLPTRKMVDAIYGAAAVKLAPTPIPPSAAMTTVPVFLMHADMVRTQRLESLAAHPLGALIAGHKKDVVISSRLAESPGKVAIYGWHRADGAPIQPLYLGHTAAWVDYSHAIRLVQQSMILNGATTTVAQVLADPKLSSLLSDEGVIVTPRYPTNAIVTPAEKHGISSGAIQLNPTGHFGERVAHFSFEPETSIYINAPAASDFAPDKPMLLIFYALPNGNTIEQTIGRAPKPGDDWHFDIQHIGAQTRFLRALVTNRTIVLACLQAQSKSWPAWRATHGDHAIPEIIDCVKAIFAANRLQTVLAGHSGGGSFTFGYLNAVEKIPDDIVRIAFLDSNYAYDPARGHSQKLAAWLKASEHHFLCVLAYNDAVALLNGKPFVSAGGGTWGRSHAMLADLGAQFDFTSQTNSMGLERHSALNGRVEILLKENPGRNILHTVQVERNGFIHAMVTGTPAENDGYEYFGERAYTKWILPE
jgi:hypothetical protein